MEVRARYRVVSVDSDGLLLVAHGMRERDERK